MRGVHRETHTPAHHNAVHQGDDRFRIGLDPPIELIFLTPKGQLGVMIARAAEVVEPPDVSAGAKGPVAGAEEHDPVDSGVAFPFVERDRNQPDHGQGQGVQRLGAIEHDDAGAAAALNERLRLWRRRASRGGDHREDRVDRLGDILDRGHAVDLMQETALAIERGHRGRVALVTPQGAI